MSSSAVASYATQNIAIWLGTGWNPIEACLRVGLPLSPCKDPMVAFVVPAVMDSAKSSTETVSQHILCLICIGLHIDHLKWKA